MRPKGFTLIEVLMAAGLMATVLATSSVLFYTLLRSSRKSTAIAAAKTEGEYALRAMDQMIRFAGNISCPVAGQLQVTRLNDDVITYSISGGALASTSGIMNQNLTSTAVTVTPCGTGLFNCTLSGLSRSVTICYVVNRTGGVDATDTTGGGGVTFTTQIGVRNWGN